MGQTFKLFCWLLHFDFPGPWIVKNKLAFFFHLPCEAQRWQNQCVSCVDVKSWATNWSWSKTRPQYNHWAWSWNNHGKPNSQTQKNKTSLYTFEFWFKCQFGGDVTTKTNIWLKKTRATLGWELGQTLIFVMQHHRFFFFLGSYKAWLVRSNKSL